ncbi:MAG TPA: aminopeptidase [Terriglobales bacterium]|nr:aminopeptidase [Terriglobales bacterium]
MGYFHRPGIRFGGIRLFSSLRHACGLRGRENPLAARADYRLSRKARNGRRHKGETCARTLSAGLRPQHSENECRGQLFKLFLCRQTRFDKLRLREEVFAQSKAEWVRRMADSPSYRSRDFLQRPLNNAVIIQYTLYLKNLKLFEALYDAEGKSLTRLIDSIREAVSKGGEPFEQLQALIDRPGTSS